MQADHRSHLRKFQHPGGLAQQKGAGNEQQACAGLRIVILDELDGLMAAKPTLQVGTVSCLPMVSIQGVDQQRHVF
jgi:hypothetical protein